MQFEEWIYANEEERGLDHTVSIAINDSDTSFQSPRTSALDPVRWKRQRKCWDDEGNTNTGNILI